MPFPAHRHTCLTWHLSPIQLTDTHVQPGSDPFPAHRSTCSAWLLSLPTTQTHMFSLAPNPSHHTNTRVQPGPDLFPPHRHTCSAWPRPLSSSQKHVLSLASAPFLSVPVLTRLTENPNSAEGHYLASFCGNFLFPHHPELRIIQCVHALGLPLPLYLQFSSFQLFSSSSFSIIPAFGKLKQEELNLRPAWVTQHRKTLNK